MAQPIYLVVPFTSTLHQVGEILSRLGVAFAITGHVDSYIEAGAVVVATDNVEYLVAWPLRTATHIQEGHHRG